MIYKNIDIHNCRELCRNDETGLYQMSRIPLELNDKIAGNAFQDSGVELRFVPTDDEIPSCRYLAYGSSITHGSLAMVQPNTYVSRVGEAFNADVINMGFAGNARLEPEMAEYIANDCYFDFATIEMGINILDIDCDDFENRVRNFVSTIARAHSDKPIFCTDVFYMHLDMEQGDVPDCKPRAFREIVKRVTDELNLPNVTYICGTDLMYGSRFLSQDGTHPNARGMEEISRNLIKIIETKIN